MGELASSVLGKVARLKSGRETRSKESSESSVSGAGSSVNWKTDGVKGGMGFEGGSSSIVIEEGVVAECGASRLAEVDEPDARELLPEKYVSSCEIALGGVTGAS